MGGHSSGSHTCRSSGTAVAATVGVAVAVGVLLGMSVAVGVGVGIVVAVAVGVGVGGVSLSAMVTLSAAMLGPLYPGSLLVAWCPIVALWVPSSVTSSTARTLTACGVLQFATLRRAVDRPN